MGVLGGGPAASVVPGWECFGEFGDSVDGYSSAVDGVGPFGSAEVPFCECYGFASDNQVFWVAGVVSADFRIVTVEDDPHWADFFGLVGEFEPGDDSVVG